MKKTYSKPQAVFTSFGTTDDIMTTSANGFTIDGNVNAGSANWNESWSADKGITE